MNNKQILNQKRSQLERVAEEHGTSWEAVGEKLTGLIISENASHGEVTPRTHKVSINNLDAVRERLCASHGEVSVNPLDLIRIEVSRECAEWLLSDIAKRRKSLEQAVADSHTRPTKRDKKNRELQFVAYSTDIINHALKHPICN